MACQNPGRLKRLSMHKVELTQVPETEQREDTVPERCHSLGCIVGAFGMKNASVHGRDLSMVLEPQEDQLAALRRSRVETGTLWVKEALLWRVAQGECPNLNWVGSLTSLMPYFLFSIPSCFPLSPTEFLV